MLTINNLSYIHSRKQQPLFENADCELHTGSIAGMLDKNGTDKTILLKLMIGLLPPYEGKGAHHGLSTNKNKSVEHCNKIRGKSSSH